MYDITEDQYAPSIRQISIFLPNRMGALLRLTRHLEREDIHIRALSILDAADHAVIRLVVDKPTLAVSSMEADGYTLFDTDLLAVRLPEGRHASLRKMLQALLMAEVNVDYIYPVLAGHDGKPVVAIHVKELEAAARTLSEHGFKILNQDELE
jgi:hypothetical protein